MTHIILHVDSQNKEIGMSSNGGVDGTADAAVSTIDPILLSTKRVVFVGGLPDGTTIPMIRAAMIPFGNIQSVDMVGSFIERFDW